MFGLKQCGELMTVNLNSDISSELAMLRGIDYGRRHQLCEYSKHDVEMTQKAYEMISMCIVKVIFNNPATIVFWGDGTKTVVKAANEPFDPEKGLAMAIAKKHFGNKGNYYNVFRKWLPEEKKIEPTDAVNALQNFIDSISNFGKGE